MDSDSTSIPVRLPRGRFVRRTPVIGRLVLHVLAHLHLSCTGVARNRPSVRLESGAENQSFSKDWRTLKVVSSRLSTHTRSTCRNPSCIRRMVTLNAQALAFRLQMLWIPDERVTRPVTKWSILRRGGERQCPPRTNSKARSVIGQLPLTSAVLCPAAPLGLYFAVRVS